MEQKTTRQDMLAISYKMVVRQLSHAIINNFSQEVASVYLAKIDAIDKTIFERLCRSAQCRLTRQSMIYILCFLIDMKTSHIASLFHVEEMSVYSMRYRLRRKFGNQMVLPF